MPRTAIAITTLKGPYPTLPVAADALDVTQTAADAANDHEWVPNRRDILLVVNFGVSPVTFDIPSVALKGRTGDITAYSIGADEVVAFDFNDFEGWIQTDGKIRIDTAAAATLKFMVLRHA